MIVHIIEVRESGPDGLIAILEPHDFERAEAVEARLISEAHLIECCVPGCGRHAGGEIIVHRRHSKRSSEPAYLCADHLTAHRSRETLRLRVESNR